MADRSDCGYIRQLPGVKAYNCEAEQNVPIKESNALCVTTMLKEIIVVAALDEKKIQSKCYSTLTGVFGLRQLPSSFLFLAYI